MLLPNRAARLAALSIIFGMLIVLVTVIAQLVTTDGFFAAVYASLTVVGFVWVGVSIFLLVRAFRRV